METLLPADFTLQLLLLFAFVLYLNDAVPRHHRTLRGLYRNRMMAKRRGELHHSKQAIRVGVIGTFAIETIIVLATLVAVWWFVEWALGG